MKIYADENIESSIIEGLRRRKITVFSAVKLGYRGKPDEYHLTKDSLRRPTRPPSVIQIIVIAVLSIACTASSFARNAVWENAIVAWEDVVSRSPGKSRGYYNLGTEYERAHRIDDAIRVFETVIGLRPNDAKAHVKLGDRYKEKGWTDRAIAAYETALSLDPNLPQAYNNLGNAMLLKGRLDMALLLYRTAVRIEPGGAEYHYNLGRTYREQGQYARALPEIERTLQLAPDHLYAREMLRELWSIETGNSRKE